MVPGELLGSHEHQTACGKRVQIWKRGDRYIARGRYRGHQFGETLPTDQVQAASALRRLLVSMENGTFVVPSERRRQPIKSGTAPRLTVRELCVRFFAEKRRLLGKKTCQDYQARLTPLMEFGEQPESKRNWPLAAEVDRDFALRFRSALQTRTVHRNGHPATPEKQITPRQIYNVLDCVRTLFHWARKAEVNLLPLSFSNPFTGDIVGQKLKKDPMRPIPIPLEDRVRLVVVMDTWQLCHLALPLVLPLRPEDFAGLLVSEVDFEKQLLRFGTRLGGRDFNKGHQSFSVPFPNQLAPLLKHCAGGRGDGPLLQSRPVFEGCSEPMLKEGSSQVIEHHVETALQNSPAGDIQSPQDQKQVVRRVLRQLGGVSETALAREFKALAARVGLPDIKKFYDLRASCSSELERSSVSHLVQRYVTGHSTDDIMYEYNSLDPKAEMQKYFTHIEPLLNEINKRASVLGLVSLHE